MDNWPPEPKNWGKDPLSEFIKTAWNNTFATFANLKPQYNCLNEIHVTYRKIIDNLINSPEWFASFFLMRAHASYIGGVRLSLSGQVPEAYIVFRGCLENSLYGLYVSRRPNTQEIWLRRHDDESSKRRCKNEFTTRNVFQCLESVDKKIHHIAQQLYDTTIDYGAHPNERGLMSLMTQEKDGSKIDFRLYYLTGNTLPLHLCIKTAARIGICSLYIFKNIYRERFDILGIAEKLKELEKGL